MGSRRTEGELLFEAYLAEHGYPEPAYEPDLGVPTRPDYVVMRGEAEAICEVEEFSADSGWSPSSAGPSGRRSMEVVMRPVRNKIREGARQLKPLAESGRPLVIVLANPSGAWVGLSPRELVWAMYGDPAYRFAINADTGEAADGEFITTRNGKLRNDHPYISALALVAKRERAVDFYEELLVGMEGALPSKSWPRSTPRRIGERYPRGTTTASMYIGG